MARILTKVVSIEQTVANTVTSPVESEEWNPQQDVYIIGARVMLLVSYASSGQPTADGAFEMWGCLTLAATRFRDGEILHVQEYISRELFGSPASGVGWVDITKQDSVMFPKGDTVQIKEGDVVNLVMQVNNDVGTTLNFNAVAEIYYKLSAN